MLHLSRQQLSTLLLVCLLSFASTPLIAQLEHERLVLGLGVSLDRVKLTAERSISPYVGLEAQLEYIVPFRDPADCDAPFATSDWVDDYTGRTLKMLHFIRSGIGARLGANFYLKQKQSTARSISFTALAAFERSGYDNRFLDEDCATGDAVETLQYQESTTYTMFGVQGLVNFHLTKLDRRWQPLIYGGLGAQYQSAEREVALDNFNGQILTENATMSANRIIPTVHFGLEVGYNLFWERKYEAYERVPPPVLER